MNKLAPTALLLLLLSAFLSLAILFIPALAPSAAAQCTPRGSGFSAVILCDASRSAVTYSLPRSNGTQGVVEICKVDQTTANVTVAPQNGDTINGQPNSVLSTPYYCNRYADDSAPRRRGKEALMGT
jgi:hypothetical protein